MIINALPVKNILIIILLSIPVINAFRWTQIGSKNIFARSAPQVLTRSNYNTLLHLAKETAKIDSDVGTNTMYLNSEQCKISEFVQDLRNILLNTTSLDQFLTWFPEDFTWSNNRNPFVNFNNKKEFVESFKWFLEFYTEQYITVFDIKETSATTAEIRYYWSFTQPMPWRPRIIVPCTAKITFCKGSSNSKEYQVTSIAEQSEVGIFDIFLKQIPPRFWDVWHVFAAPVAEYPPIKNLLSKKSVIVREIPETIMVEVTWRGLSTFPGPTLTSVPGFSLVGDIRTKKGILREDYLPTLPVEVESAVFVDPVTQEDMKQTKWYYHVPTSLHKLIEDKADSGEIFPLDTPCLSQYYIQDQERAAEERAQDEAENNTTITKTKDYQDEDELEPTVKADYDIGEVDDEDLSKIPLEMLPGTTMMKIEDMIKCESAQQASYRYIRRPKQLVVSTPMYGIVGKEKIVNALKKINTVLKDGGLLIDGKVLKSTMKSRIEPALLVPNNITTPEGGPDSVTINPSFGLHSWSVKACFDVRGLPVMAVYEMQYNKHRTDLFFRVEQ